MRETLSPGPALELARAVLESRESRPKNPDSNTVFLDCRDWEYVKELARQVEESEGRSDVVGRATINRSKPGRHLIDIHIDWHATGRTGEHIPVLLVRAGDIRDGRCHE